MVPFALFWRFWYFKNMAQRVGYFENDVKYSEGPFVIVSLGGWWRIECEVKEYFCPTIPDDSIFPIKEQLGLIGKTNNTKLAETVCDKLNAMVHAGKIILEGNWWIFNG